MKKIVIVALLSMVNCLLSFAQIGTWRNYLAYHDIQQIQAASGDDIFVLASNGLYQYNKADKSITTYDKVNGLSDTDISQIRWCQQAKRLIAVYSNMNIDLVETNGNITNISSIYTKAITGDKTINSITINGPYAYLSCGFGIVKVNVRDAEISESYILGFVVKATTFDNSSIYAQSATGSVWKAPLTSNLIDKSNWQQTTDYPSFEQDNSDYEKHIDVVKTLNLDGPENNNIGFLRFTNNNLYTCGGISGGNFGPNIPGSIQMWDGNRWNIYQNRLDTITGHSYRDLASVDVDPLDDSHVFAAGRTGLYEFRNGKFVKEYNYDNSPLKTTAAIDSPSKDYTMVETVKFDQKGSLWLLNSGSATTSLFEITKDGQWIDHHKKELQNTSSRAYDNMVNAMFDSNGTLWFCNDRFIEPALLRYQPSADEARAYKTFTNQDGTTPGSFYSVSSVAEDYDGNVWVGTDVGPFLFEQSQWSETSPYFTQVKVPRNDGTNYADYLLAGIGITSIAIDGGGRKWFGTNGNGVYLISQDNMTQLQHFTTNDCPLLSNNILSIAINPSSGEVFFGTDKGLCSYISDATQTNTEMNTDNVWAYPNPVTPGYTGLITVTGLSMNSDVKILSANGALVAEGKSNGGSFTWDGNDKKGRRVASGVYMVVTATSKGEKGTVCKIAIVN